MMAPSSADASEPSCASEPQAPAPSVSRRTFIDAMIAGQFAALGGTCLWAAARYAGPLLGPADMPSRVSVGLVSDFAAGSARIVRYGPEPVIVLRDKAGQFRAFSAICSHLGCTVAVRMDHGDVFCACHSGVYDLAGQVVSGPPTSSLAPYQVEVVGPDLWVKRS